MSRQYPAAPIMGVGSVVVAPDRRSIVLVRRGHAPLAGEWSLPGGAVELGETLEEAVMREMLEETGLQVEPVRMLKTFDRIHRDSSGRVQYHYVLVDFLCHATGGTLLAGSDALQACWVKVDDLVRYNLSAETLEVVHHALLQQ